MANAAEPPVVLVPDKKRPWKALVPAFLGTAYVVVEGAQVAYGDNVWDTNDTFTVVLLGLASLTTYFVKNPVVPK